MRGILPRGAPVASRSTRLTLAAAALLSRAGDRACPLDRLVRQHHGADLPLDLLLADGRRSGLIVVATRRGGGWPARLALYVLAAAVLVPGPYLWTNYIDIIRSGGIADGTDMALFVVATAAALVLARYLIGWVMVGLGVVGAGLCLLRQPRPRRLRPCRLRPRPGHLEPVPAHRGPLRPADGRGGAIHPAVLAARHAAAAHGPRAGLRRSRARADRPGAGRPGADGRRLLDDVLVDQRLGGGGRGHDRHLHHPADEAHRLLARSWPARSRRRPPRPARSCRR